MASQRDTLLFALPERALHDDEFLARLGQADLRLDELSGQAIVLLAENTVDFRPILGHDEFPLQDAHSLAELDVVLRARLVQLLPRLFQPAGQLELFFVGVRELSVRAAAIFEAS